MVDADRLIVMLSRVTARLAILDEYAAADTDELLADRVRLGDLKYTFQTAIEACIDAAHHIVASEGLGPLSSNADAFRRLAAHGILDEPVATTMVAAVGFRNLLVHGYAEIDDGLVVAHLSHLVSLRAFVAAASGLAG